MTDATREYGVYRSASSPSPAEMRRDTPSWVAPAVCQASPSADPIVRRVWDETEGLAYLYIWHVLLSF